MFVTPIVQPYATNKGMPVYLDGYSYLGIVNLQIIDKVWPATAGLENSDHRFFEVLKK